MKSLFAKPLARCGILVVASFGFAFFVHAASTSSSKLPRYRLGQEVSLPGDEFWDYLTADGNGKRLFVAHGTRVQVLNLTDNKLAGEIADTPGVHGVALADDLGRGYISAGRSGMIVVFDLKSLARLQEIKATGDNPDAILYDAFTHKIFSFNGRGRNVTVIDAKTNEITATIAVDAKPEAGVTDLAGHVYLNLEDKHSIAVIDAKKAVLEKTWPLAGCEEPSGLAIDRKHQRLFSVCGNKIMAIVDAKSGRMVTTVPIGARVDGTVFDAKTELAFASGGDGTMTIVHEDTPDKYSVVQTVTTKVGARTLTLDETTHKVYTATAKFNIDPAKPNQRPTVEPGSFSILTLETE
jgi:YVTN family beta-propeller protein